MIKTNNNPLVKQQSTNQNSLGEVKKRLHAMATQFKTALPAHIEPSEFSGVVMTMLNNNSSLLNLDRESLFNECILCAQDGLLPNGREAAMVPFKGKIKYMPMINGIIKRMRNSGKVKSLTSEIVYENDQFDYYVDGEGAHVMHRPQVFGERGAAIGCYAVCLMTTGQPEIEVMSSSEVQDVKGISQAASKGNSPWDGPFKFEMWKKTVIRRLSKRLYLTPELDKLVRRDDNMYDLNQIASKNSGPSKADILSIKLAEPPIKEAQVIQEAQVDDPEWDAVFGDKI